MSDRKPKPEGSRWDNVPMIIVKILIYLKLYHWYSQDCRHVNVKRCKSINGSNDMVGPVMTLNPYLNQCNKSRRYAEKKDYFQLPHILQQPLCDVKIGRWIVVHVVVKLLYAYFCPAISYFWQNIKILLPILLARKSMQIQWIVTK